MRRRWTTPASPHAPTAAQESVLCVAAPIVARRMVLERERADVAHWSSTARVGELLSGGPPR